MAFYNRINDTVILVQDNNFSNIFNNVKLDSLENSDRPDNLNLNKDKKVRERIIDYFTKHIYKDWLLNSKKFKRIFYYLKIENDDNNNVIVKLTDYNIDNHNPKSILEYENKLKYIKSELLTYNFIAKSIKSYLINKRKEWIMLPKYKHNIKKYMYKRLLKKIDKCLNK